MLQTTDLYPGDTSLRIVLDDEVKSYQIGHQATFGDVAARVRYICPEGHRQPRNIAVFMSTAQNATRMQFAAKQSLLNQSECSEFVHVIEKGTVQVQRTICDGRRFVARFALPGDTIGLWTERDSRFSVEALELVTTCRIPRVALRDYLDSRPVFRDRMQNDAERELAAANDRLMMLARYNAREKVAAFLIQMRDRWLALDGHCMYVPLPMSRRDIGDFLGITIETVSRIISAMARERLLVVVPDGVRLIDLPRLRAIGLTHNTA